MLSILAGPGGRSLAAQGGLQQTGSARVIARVAWERTLCATVFPHCSVDLEMLVSYADMYLVSRGAAVRTSLTSAAEARRRRFEQIYAAGPPHPAKPAPT
jgi:hypothetical protein